MTKPHFTQEQLVQIAKLTDEDIERIDVCRGVQNKIGFAYQLCYAKLFNRLPSQSPLEILKELSTFVAIQLDLPQQQLQAYSLRQPTVSSHQEQIRNYLSLRKFDKYTEKILREHIFQQALQIQAIDPLLLLATEFLKQNRILNPADDTLERLIQPEREKARKWPSTNIRALGRHRVT